LGESRAIEGLKQELLSANAERPATLERGHLESAMSLLRSADAEWVSTWVTQQILSGTVHGDDWLHMVNSISSTLKKTLLDRITNEDLRTKNAPGVIPLLRRFADGAIVKQLFRRICELRPIIAESRPGDDKRGEAELDRQLENMLHEMSPDLVIGTILEEVADKANAAEVKVIVNIFNIAGREGVRIGIDVVSVQVGISHQRVLTRLGTAHNLER
jgi:hypothetical protein